MLQPKFALDRQVDNLSFASIISGSADFSSGWIFSVEWSAVAPFRRSRTVQNDRKLRL